MHPQKIHMYGAWYNFSYTVIIKPKKTLDFFFVSFFVFDNHTEYYLQHHTYINNINYTFYVDCVTTLTINIYASYIVLPTLLTKWYYKQTHVTSFAKMKRKRKGKGKRSNCIIQ